MKYSGIVIEGSKRGRALGFPTANIELSGGSVSGIYIAKATAQGTEYHAAVFADPSRKLLEAYLLDFSGDLYGETISVELMKKIREIETFPNEDTLKKAIWSDVEHVRAYFA